MVIDLALSNEIQKKIGCWMNEPGVQVCLDQGSNNFENFIQVKLAGFLRGKLKKYTVKVESNADLLISSKDNQPLAALELKVGKLCGLKFYRQKDKKGVLDDLDKLVKRYPDSCERMLICIIYQFGTNQYPWGVLGNKGSVEKNQKDYQKMLCDELDKCGEKTGGWRQNSIVSQKMMNFGSSDHSRRNGVIDIFSF